MEWTLRIGATPLILELSASSVGRGHDRGGLGGRSRGGRLERRHGVPALGVDDDRRAVGLDHGRREVDLEGPGAVGLHELDLELGLAVRPLGPGRRLGGDDDDLRLRLERRGLLGPALTDLGSLADLLGRELGRARLARLVGGHGLLVAAAAVEVARGLLVVDVLAGVALAHVGQRLVRAAVLRQGELPVVEALQRAGRTLVLVGPAAVGAQADLLPRLERHRGLRCRLDGREHDGLRDRGGGRHVRLGGRRADLGDRLLALGAVAGRGAGGRGRTADLHRELPALALLHAPVGAEARDGGRLDLHGRHHRRGDDHGDRLGHGGGRADGKVGGRLGDLVAAHGGDGLLDRVGRGGEGTGGGAEDAGGEGLERHGTSKAPERKPSGSVTRSSFEREKNAGNSCAFLDTRREY